MPRARRFAGRSWLRSGGCPLPESMSVNHWTYIVVSAFVLLIVVAALFPTLTKSLTGYAKNDTSGIGTILETVVPLLIGVGILLAFVFAFLPRGKKA